ncbi:hypothetical protein N7648_05115 [Enterobacter roggenkampii]|uniref:hypothetical protein n=1 Tax=Enterobacterales TaxID=91347 RepID=UPI0010335650|nr:MULTISPECIES: hypothetical protein [Enterobacterales]MCL8154072.1 hypothetical protein [Enterobacter roggenkampii]MCM7558190.1 hypothetical protein [Enterobacter roggenkampii]MDH0554307.1 hypothetical protein [Enterobacter roggenkampii]TBL50560.1 hypothetical protein EYY98_08960 [Obesumbacterium proteus]
MKIITRAEAAKSGLKKFYTGKECRSGHKAERYVLNGTCVQCALESANRYRNEVSELLRAAQEGAA